jgi:histidinol-phosphatase (PHP family)
MSFYDSHTHTSLCGHAEGEPIDYAKSAARRGLSGLIVTDHNPFASDWEAGIRMAPYEFYDYLDMINRARSAWAGIIDIRPGIECDFVPGMEKEIEAVVGLYAFDYVLGSVHCNTNSYIKRFYEGDALEYTRLYYDHMGLAAESGFYDALSHPDVPKFMWPKLWDFDRIRPDVIRFLDRVAASGTALELNTSGLLKPYPEMNPGREMLILMKERNIPVVIGSDAHQPHRTGEGFVEGLHLLQQVGFEKVSYYLKRQRVDQKIRTVLRELT